MTVVDPVICTIEVDGERFEVTARMIAALPVALDVCERTAALLLNLEPDREELRKLRDDALDALAIAHHVSGSIHFGRA